MKKLIILGLLTAGLSGCADIAPARMGSEAIIFEEQHSFVIEVKKAATKADISEQINRIISSFESGLSTTTWTLNYKTKTEKNWALAIQKKLLKLGLNPDNIKFSQQASKMAGVVIVVSEYQIETENCRRIISGEMTSDMGCFVDSARLKQVRNLKTFVDMGKS